MIRFLIVIAFCLFASSEVSAHAYFNSSEPGCDGSDTNVAFCEDFEDGAWYATDCDTSGGITNAANDGWCGTIFANPITPAGAAVCGAGVTPFGLCVGTAGTKTGETDRNMALRHLKTSSCGTNGSELCEVSTIYVRWYAKWLTGYSFGAEKHMNITNADSDIAFANLQLNCGIGPGGVGPTAGVDVQVLHGENFCESTGVTLSANKWYFFEMRLTAHATNGIIQVWINDCGTDGTDCGEGTSNPTPTMVYNESGLQLPGNSNGSMIETIWLESWASPVSTGTGPYWDQVKASIVGPIGFAGEEGGEEEMTEMLDYFSSTDFVWLAPRVVIFMHALLLLWGLYALRNRKRSPVGPRVRGGRPRERSVSALAE